MISTYAKNSGVQLAKNFNSNEFDCKGKDCCHSTQIDSKLVEILQKIRDHFGKAVIINSAFRCEVHNKVVGGANKSKHKDGMAADIVVKGINPAQVAAFAENLGVKGIGLYDDFVHVDTRIVKSYWYGYKEEYRSTFGGLKENSKVKEWQKAAMADGFYFEIGADGLWGSECVSVATKAVCKKRLTYKYKNLTKIVQKAVGVTVDGKFGNDTRNAVIKWQKLMGLTADGCVGINTWKKILGVK